MKQRGQCGRIGQERIAVQWAAAGQVVAKGADEVEVQCRSGDAAGEPQEIAVRDTAVRNPIVEELDVRAAGVEIAQRIELVADCERQAQIGSVQTLVARPGVRSGADDS